MARLWQMHESFRPIATPNFWQWRIAAVLVLFFFINPSSAALRDLVKAARSAKKSDAIDRWNEVLSLDATNGEAVFRVATIEEG